MALPLKKYPLPICSIFIIALICIFVKTAQGQDQQRIIVGLLTGEHDRRNLRIETRLGNYPVVNSGNYKHFRATSNNQERLLVNFNRDFFDFINDRRPSGVEFRFFATERSLVSSIILNEIDYTILNNDDSAREVEKGTRSYRILPRRPQRSTVEFVGYNFSSPILRDRRVRLAISYAINKRKIKEQLLYNKADISKGAFDEGSVFYMSKKKKIKYKPKQAINLLKQAGWETLNNERVRLRNGKLLRFRILFQKGLDLEEKVVRLIKIDCIQIGVDIVPVPLDAAALHDSLQSGNFDAVLLRHKFEEDLNSLTDFFGDGSGKGVFRYKSKRFHFNYNLSKKSQTAEQLRSAAMSLQAIIYEEQTVTFLFHPWVEYHIINIAKVEFYLGQNGKPMPFEKWLIRKNH